MPQHVRTLQCPHCLHFETTLDGFEAKITLFDVGTIVPYVSRTVKLLPLWYSSWLCVIEPYKARLLLLLVVIVVY